MEHPCKDDVATGPAILPGQPLRGKIVNVYFLSKHLTGYETPHPHDRQNVGPPTSSLGHLLPEETVSELAKTRFFEQIINNLRCAKV